MRSLPASRPCCLESALTINGCRRSAPRLAAIAITSQPNQNISRLSLALAYHYSALAYHHSALAYHHAASTPDTVVIPSCVQASAEPEHCLVCTHVYTSIYAHVYTHVYIQTEHHLVCTPVYTHVYTHVYAHVYCVNIHMCMHMCVHISMRMPMLMSPCCPLVLAFQHIRSMPKVEVFSFTSYNLWCRIDCGKIFVAQMLCFVLHCTACWQLYYSPIL